MGTTELWIQARLLTQGWNAMAQFLRYDPTRTNNAFDLKVNYGNNGTTTTLLSNNATALATDIFTIPAATPADVGTYYVIVSDRYYNTIYESNATSSNATLSINGYPLTITTHPSNATVTAGNNATFTVVANGIAPITYQWYKNGTILGGQTNSTLLLTSVPLGDNNSTYYVFVADPYSNATSNNGTLTVNP